MVPLVLKLEDWPGVDRRQWASLTASGTLFEDGPFAGWSEGTARMRCQGYGQWLSYLMRHHPDELCLAPVERITIDHVRGFLEECQKRLANRSTYILLTSVLVLAMEMDPARDWEWLRMVQLRLRHSLNDTALPERPSITADEVFDWSLRRLQEVEALDGITDRRRAIWFRQALMIGFLISRPVRRRTLLAMEVGTHLQPIDQGYMLSFSAEDMKDCQQRSFHLPKILVVPMTRYLEQHRKVLLDRGNSRSLWISQHGRPITPDGFARELPKITERHLGVALRPHAFRHIAATSIAERDPEHVGITRDILGHQTLRMAEKHYNRAQQVESAKRYGAVLEELKKRLS